MDWCRWKIKTFASEELLFCHRFQKLHHGHGLELNRKNLQGVISVCIPSFHVIFFLLYKKELDYYNLRIVIFKQIIKDTFF